MQQEKQFFPALTGYRAIAAWMIFVYHFMPFESGRYNAFVKKIIYEFHIGVTLFFVLSGFLITYRYYHQNPINIKKYLINRFARIYPMYFLLTAGVFFLWYLQNDRWSIQKTIEMILSFSMTKALFSKYFLAGIPQGWTLTLEEMFYFSAPLFFLLIRKNKMFFFIIPILIFLLGTFIKIVFSETNNVWGVMQVNISLNIFEFFSGIALAFIVMKSKVNSKNGFYTYWGVFFLAFYLCVKQFLFKNIDVKNDFVKAFLVIIPPILGIVPFLYGLIHEKTIIQKILSNKWMVLLGKSSYIFYLIHKGFIPVFINDYISDNKLVIFILLNIISIFMFTYLEEPINHFIRNKFGKSKT